VPVQRRDLDRDVLRPLIPSRALQAYTSPEYVKDMGTPQRLVDVDHDITSGLVTSRNLSLPQRALFLDRDGTINRDVGYLTRPDQFSLRPGVTDLIGAANRDGRLVLVVTNQPVIARGDVTWGQLRAIHDRMETLLGQEGTYVNDIFVCPHHPDSGFAGEVPEYKTVCCCRKPQPGLILAAAKKYNVDLRRSLVVGDSASDSDAAKAAGCEFVWADDALSSGHSIPPDARTTHV
jgi:D-glycero-D-manno-heptose 1,7-bisphosphate phosphatase